MPVDEIEQNQDEAAILPWRFGYPLPNDEDSESKPSIGMRIIQMAPTQAPPDEPWSLRGTDVQLQQVTQGGPKPGPGPSIGQRIMQIGNQGVPPFDIQDGWPASRQDPQATAKPSIGQRIMRSASSGMPQSVPLPNTASAVNGVSLPPEQHGLFSSFIPTGTIPTTSGPDDPQTPQRQAVGNEALGRSVGQAAGALTEAGLGGGQMLNPSAAVPGATQRMNSGSIIQGPAAARDVRPNLNINNPRQTRRALGRTLAPLMQSIRGSQPPQAVRHLTQDDRDTAAGVAYSENTRATVPEYEAIISVILNRARSGQRQFVDPDQPLTVENVMQAHARRRNGQRGINQFQGVGGANQQNFTHTHDPGSQNARSAAENIAAHGPTNRATFFIVTRDGNPPPTRQVQNLGRNLAQVGHEGSVYLYAPAPTPPVARRHARQPHTRSNPDHSRAAHR